MGALVTGCALLPIGLLTLRPMPGEEYMEGVTVWCLRCGETGSVDVVLNLLLFVPLGVGLGMLGVPRIKAMGWIAALSFGIEYLQLVAIVGRWASVSDVLSNTAGGWLGIWAAMHWRAMLFPEGSTARVIGTSACLGWIALRLATGWMLTPSNPPGTLFGMRAPKTVYPSAFRGVILDASISSLAVPHGPFAGLRDRLATAPVSAVAAVIPAGATHRVAAVIAVFDDQRREHLLLGQDGFDARFRIRLRAAEWKFRVPSVRLRGAFDVPSGARLTLAGRLEDGLLRLTSETSGDSRASVLPLTAGLTWSLLLPFDPRLDGTARWITALATTVLLSLVGYFAARASPRVAMTVLPPVLATGFLLPQLFFPLSSPDAIEVCGAVLGGIAGLAAGRIRVRQASAL